ncbi:MAG: hypothetical protein WC489_06800 [Patescibacteria group bacterium]|jgi:hypothetical protein
MSWFYRFFSKSDNEQVVTLNSPYIQLTGSATLTGALTVSDSPVYFGTGTLGIFFGTATPWSTGIADADKGSIYMQTVGGTIYYKTDYGSKSWSTVTGTTS